MQLTGKTVVRGKSKSVNAWAFWTIVVLSLFLYNVPLIGLILAPINRFATMVHELSHAFVCMATGGYVTGMTIVSDGDSHGGLTFCHSGMPFFYTQAGYLGTAVFGCLLICLGQYPRLSKAILCLMGIVMSLASFFLVGANIALTGWQGFFSLGWGLAMSLFLLWAGSKWKPDSANLLLLFLAIQTALNSVVSIVYLAQTSLGMAPFSSFSDATSMENLTQIPAPLWSVLWVLLSLALVGVTLWGTYGRGIGALFGTQERH